MDARVCAFTDTYLPTINGVTYTVKTWRDRWSENGGEMPVVYPKADGYSPDSDEHPVTSLPFPFYGGYRMGLPSLPADIEDIDIVHAHTPFGLGLAALRAVRSSDTPLVASFHTPCKEYTQYISPLDSVARGLSRISQRYEQWFLNQADMVVAPTERAASYLTEQMAVERPIAVVPNGVDLERFAPGGGDRFRERYALGDGPIIGYTGRHGYEKRLQEVIEAAAAGPAEWTVVLGGEGPATDDLEDLAADRDIDLRTLGFLDRDELAEFYSALDVFAFPSPIETQGLVALESIACGTPVVGVDEGALAETIEPERTGYHYRRGDPAHFADQLERALEEQATLSAHCLDAREEISLEAAIDELDTVYERVLAE